MRHMIVVFGLVLVALSACTQSPEDKVPAFDDWSYRVRDKEHNRYEGYDMYHVREEQWQTDPYWTEGEGLERRKAERARVGQMQPQSAPVQSQLPMPPARFMVPPKKRVTVKKPVQAEKQAPEPKQLMKH